MKRTNREVIEKLVPFFMKKPKKLICLLFAVNLIDLNEIINWHSLDKKQMKALFERVQVTIQDLHNFVKILDNEDEDEDEDV